MPVRCFECVPLSDNMQATLQQILQEAQNCLIHQRSHCNNLQNLTVCTREKPRARWYQAGIGRTKFNISSSALSSAAALRIDKERTHCIALRDPLCWSQGQHLASCSTTDHAPRIFLNQEGHKSLEHRERSWGRDPRVRNRMF